MKAAEKKRIRSQILDGSIYKKKKYKNWRRKIFERDRYRCQMPGCGQVGGHLQAHHIKKKYKYPERIYWLSNGITLCFCCHQELHEEGKEDKYVRKFKKIAKENKPKPKIKRIRSI